MIASRAGRTVAAFALALTFAAPAFADATDAELAAARSLFVEGKKLEKTNDWQGALERFNKVGEVKMTPQVRYHIALCQENLGHLVAAINGFELAVSEAKLPNANAEDVLENAPPRAEALRDRVGKLHLDVKGEVISSRVLLDGSPIAKALFGTDIPIDPGEHKLEVETGGKIVDTKNVKIAEKDTKSLAFEIHDKEEVTPPPAATDTAPPPKPEPTVNRMPVWIAGGVGVAGLAASGIFLILKTVDVIRVEDACTSADGKHGCDPTTKPIANEAQTFATVSTVSFFVGLAGAATAGVLYFTIKPKKDAKTSLQIAPTLGGFSARGSF